MSENGSEVIQRNTPEVSNQPKLTDVINHEIAETLSLKGRDSTPDLEEEISFKKYIARQRRLSGILTAGTLALGLGLSSIESSAQENTDQASLTPEQIHTVEGIMGKPFDELSEQFNISIPVPPDESNKYIVLLGQIHPVPFGSELYNPEVHRIVKKNQQEVYEIAESAVRANQLSCIFAEGVTSDRYPMVLKDSIREISQSLDGLHDKDVLSQEDFDLALRYLAVHGMFVSLDSDFYHYLQPEIEQLKTKIRESVAHEMDSNLYPEEKILEMTVPNRLKEVPDPVYAGAPFKLFMDSKVDKICPAASEEVDMETSKTLKKYAEQEDAYEKLATQIEDELSRDPKFSGYIKRYNELVAKGRENVTPEELEEAVRILNQVNEQIANDPRVKEALSKLEETGQRYSELNAKREKSIFENIDSYDKKEAESASGSDVHRVIIYGSGHMSKLIENLEAWNDNNAQGDIDRGMISLIPKDEALIREGKM